MVLSVTWDNKTPENFAIARQITRELNERFVAGQVEELGHFNLGYASGNIGMGLRLINFIELLNCSH